MDGEPNETWSFRAGNPPPALTISWIGDAPGPLYTSQKPAFQMVSHLKNPLVVVFSSDAPFPFGDMSDIYLALQNVSKTE